MGFINLLMRVFPRKTKRVQILVILTNVAGLFFLGIGAYFLGEIQTYIAAFVSVVLLVLSFTPARGNEGTRCCSINSLKAAYCSRFC